MADYGAKVSLKGYDVKTAADRNLVYSSAFQTLKINSSQAVSTTIPGAGTNTITITHNLGFLAPCLVVYNGSTTRGFTESFFFSDTLAAIDIEQEVNELKILVSSTFDAGVSGSGDTVNFTVYIFHDDFRTVTEKTIILAPPSTTASSTDYGFRVSKAGFDVKTAADKDLVLSSSLFSEIIHKKGTTTGATITHNLGYIPNYFVWTKSSGDSYLHYDPLLQSATSAQINTGLLVGDTAYYVIFKNRLA